jgi:SSS family solute:Na+ symporter
MVYAFLFGAGKIILGEPATGIVFLSAGLIAGGYIYFGMERKGWKIK